MSEIKLLYLQLYQAEILINNSRKYNFSDQKKVEYLSKVIELFDAIKISIDTNFNIEDLFNKKNHLDFIFKSIEFLKDSTLNTIPFEVVGCLDRAMNDWINADDFIIVTSLQNNLYSFSYDIQYAKKDLFYKSLEIEYNITFKRKLVQINLPIVLSKDYLSSVALYHELGHFVDNQHQITSVAYHYLISNNASDEEKMQLLPFFPYLMTSPLDNSRLYYHLGEYFCDIFAGQYIGETLSHYLGYITNNESNDSPTHPSTVNRALVLKDFLEGNANPVVALLQNVTNHLLDKSLKIRFEKIDSDDFYKFLPYEIKNDKELHGIIEYGWDIWLSDFDRFNQLMGYNVNLTGASIYKVINNLIEKSIGNYFITNSWLSGKNE